MTPALAILHAARLLVPREQRQEWFAEWQSELWYVRSTQNKTIAFCLGAFRDAFWLRQNALPGSGPSLALASPYRCLVFLAVLAAIAVFSPFHVPFPPDNARPTMAALLRVCLVIGAVMAFLVWCLGVLQRGLELLEETLDRPAIVTLDLGLPTSLPFGTSSVNRRAPRGAAWLGRAIFLTIKCVLLVLIVVFGSFDLGPAAGSGMMFFYVLGLRWATADQRNRCPICLRRLTNPTRIGEASHTFLDWYGTEFVCAKGHGLLHVPEIHTSCYSAPRWHSLDPSWNSLFAAELSARSSV
jgi:hypothetical protein